MSKRPLWKRWLYGFLLVLVWVVFYLSPKYLGMHLNAIGAGVFCLFWLFVFSKTTGLNMGFNDIELDFSWLKRDSEKNDK